MTPFAVQADWIRLFFTRHLALLYTSLRVFGKFFINEYALKKCFSSERCVNTACLARYIVNFMITVYKNDLRHAFIEKRTCVVRNMRTLCLKRK